MGMARTLCCYKKELSKDKKGNVTWNISYNTSSD